jgi:hypothetical protein
MDHFSLRLLLRRTLIKSKGSNAWVLTVYPITP